MRRLPRAVRAGATLMLSAIFSVTAAAQPLANLEETVTQHALLPPALALPPGATPQHVREFLRGFDPYAQFFTPQEYEMARAARDLFPAGVGMDIVRNGAGLIVCLPYPGLPAALGGVLYGDVLLSVDGLDVKHADLQDVAVLVRGTPDSQVRLRLRGPTGRERNLALRRVESPLPSVWMAAPVHGTPRIRLSRFRRGTVAELDILLAVLSANSPLILDLRGNTGGDLEEALGCASRFLCGGSPLLSWESHEGGGRTRTEKNGTHCAAPLYIWQDDLTASAAEACIAALIQNGRAVTVGPSTAGKARAQEWFVLNDGGRLKLTTTRLCFFDGNDWQRSGLRSHVAVPPDSLLAEEVYARLTIRLLTTACDPRQPSATP